MAGLFGQVDEGPASPEQQAVDIYTVYPRKVGRRAAIKAILAAMKRLKGQVDCPFKHLKDATDSFAAAVAKWPDHQRTFIPHAATFFNQERYDDDRAEWNRENSKPSTAADRRSDKAGGEYAEGTGPIKTY